MIRLYTTDDGIQVLTFDDADEARMVGSFLVKMGDDGRQLALAHGATEEQLRKALKEALEV